MIHESLPPLDGATSKIYFAGTWLGTGFHIKCSFCVLILFRHVIYTSHLLNRRAGVSKLFDDSPKFYHVAFLRDVRYLQHFVVIEIFDFLGVFSDARKVRLKLLF